MFVLFLMIWQQNFSTAAWVYLALHGSYGLLWLLKDRIYPDKQWEKKVTIPYALFVFVVLGLYWIAPWVLIQGFHEPAPWLIGLAVALCMLGTMLHFASDAQKFYMLKYRPGLITEGFFARSRNTNYLGELMIYCGFASLSASWLGFLGITAFGAGAFIPNMIRKDKSLARYPGFVSYRKQSGLFLPR